MDEDRTLAVESKDSSANVRTYVGERNRPRVLIGRPNDGSALPLKDAGKSKLRLDSGRPSVLFLTSETSTPPFAKLRVFAEGRIRRETTRKKSHLSPARHPPSLSRPACTRGTNRIGHSTDEDKRDDEYRSASGTEDGSASGTKRTKRYTLQSPAEKKASVRYNARPTRPDFARANDRAK